MELTKLRSILDEYSPRLQILSHTTNYSTIRLSRGEQLEGFWTFTFHRTYMNEARLRSVLDALFRQP